MYLTTNTAADLLGISPKTLTSWRSSDKGPKFCAFGRAIRYEESDILSYIKKSQRYTKDDPRKESSDEHTKKMISSYCESDHCGNESDPCKCGSSEECISEDVGNEPADYRPTGFVAHQEDAEVSNTLDDDQNEDMKVDISQKSEQETGQPNQKAGAFKGIKTFLDDFMSK